MVTPSAQGRLNGLNGDPEFGFNALDFTAPDKLSKKEVLEFLGRFLKTPDFSFLNSCRLEFRQGAELLPFITWTKSSVWCRPSHSIISRERHESACGDQLIQFFGGKRRSLSRALRSWLCSAAQRARLSPGDAAELLFVFHAYVSKASRTPRAFLAF